MQQLFDGATNNRQAAVAKVSARLQLTAAYKWNLSILAASGPCLIARVQRVNRTAMSILCLSCARSLLAGWRHGYLLAIKYARAAIDCGHILFNFRSAICSFIPDYLNLKPHHQSHRTFLQLQIAHMTLDLKSA